MSRQRSRSTIPVLPVVLIWALLIVASGLSSAETLASSYSFIQAAKLTSSDVEDDFGQSVSISGDTVVVGDDSDDEGGNSAGAAYVFEKPGAGWTDMTETLKITASDASEYDRFGESVSISGDFLVVGASGSGNGAAYVFERDEGVPGNWVQVAKLTASDSELGDYFGWKVFIRGDMVVVGDFGDGELGNQSGAAYVFEKPGTGWTDTTETAKLTASDAVDNHLLGLSVAVDGDTVVVGALEPDWRGSAYIFERPVSGWVDATETAKLTASDSAADDAFGRSVSISGDVVMVGADGDDDNGEGSGSVYVFEKPGTGWTNATEMAKLTAADGADGDDFGWSVSLGGDILVVGARYDDDNGDASGSAYLFEEPDAGWTDMTETAKLTASDGLPFDGFGYSVSLGGDIIAVGAHGAYYAPNKAAYLFYKFEPSAWIYLPIVLRSAP